MSDRPFSSLVPDISADLQGCPQPLIVTAIRRAAVHACETSLMWRTAGPKIDLLPGVHEYDYVKPSDADVHVVFSAAINNVPVETLTLEQAVSKYPAWADVYSGQSASVLWSLTPSYPFNTQEYNEDTFNPAAPFILPEAVLADASEPRSVAQLTPDKFVVLPLPDNMKSYSIRFVHALKPKRSASGLPAAVFSELEEPLIHGALRYLFAVPNTAWSDRDLANFHGRMYATRIAERRARANLTNFRGAMTVTAPSFA